MFRALRQLLFVLIGFAIVGGATMQLAQAAQYGVPVTVVAKPCAMMMQQADHGMPMAPCKDMMHDCIKLIGCVTAAALPERCDNPDVAAGFTAVRYWTASSRLADRASTPEPLPPRTL